MLQLCYNIRQARTSKNLSQIEMAKRLGVKRTTYRNWEETTEPDLTILKSIAKALDVPAYTLLKGVIDFTGKETSGLTKPDDPESLAVLFKLRDIENLRRSLNVLNSAFEELSYSGKVSPGGLRAQQRLPLGNTADEKKPKGKPLKQKKDK